MAVPIVDGLSVTFPRDTIFAMSADDQMRVMPINSGASATLTFEPCTIGIDSVEIYWKHAKPEARFIECSRHSWVGKTAISDVSVFFNGAVLPKESIGVHPRGMVYSSVPISDALARAVVSFSYKSERYDLIELTPTGKLNVVRGRDDDFAASEFLPKSTPGSMPLYHVYVWNNQLELIDAHTWIGATPNDPLRRSRIQGIQEYNRKALPKLQEAVANRRGLTIAGYGDSITAVGGAWGTGGEALLNTAGGHARDTSSFFLWHTPALREKYPELGAQYPQRDYLNVRWGWGHRLCETLSQMTGAHFDWRNWGIGGSTSAKTGSDTTVPSGDDPLRLASFLSSSFDVVIINFQMNDFVGFSSADLMSPLGDLVDRIRSSKPECDIILMGAPGINSENPNKLEWLARADDIYREVAVMKDCGYVPTYMVTHGDPSYLQISRQSYAAANRYNHPSPYELSKLAEWLIVALGFNVRQED